MSAAPALERRGGREFSLPRSRGPLSEALFLALLEGPHAELPEPELVDARDPLADEDLQLALYVCYELHYAAIEGVEDGWEWAPSLLRFRGALERRFEERLEDLAHEGEAAGASPAAVAVALRELVAADDGPPLSRYAERQATRQQLLEHVVHRSAYQLKEADPHSFAIPRLTGAAKAAMLEIQFDEYGAGRAQRMHAALFARAMRALGLDDAYGAYLDLIPGITLASVNLMSLFGLHRRLRGALVGHLAVFEMTSSIPNRRYANALRRLGYGEEATAFYDEHVEADAVHESIAAHDLAGGLAAAEPQLAGDILFGARALLALEARWAAHLLHCWGTGQSSLLAGL